MVSRPPRAALVLALLLACGDDPGALYVHVRSGLEIGRETNTLAARVLREGGASVERSYGLGAPPTDQWPQVLPILAGPRGEEQVTVSIELRNSRAGMPSVAVGYGEVGEVVPARGAREVALEIPRACNDRDGDGYGSGFGCIQPDCDDSRPDVPDPNFCAPPPRPDGGMAPDSGAPLPDAGPAGTDGGGVFCDGVVCSPGYECIANLCMKRCTINEECDDLSFGCLQPLGVCICRVPCVQGGSECGPFECRNGCCAL